MEEHGLTQNFVGTPVTSILVRGMMDQTIGRLVYGDMLMMSFVVRRVTFDTRYTNSRHSEQSVALSLHQSERQCSRELIRFPGDRSLIKENTREFTYRRFVRHVNKHKSAMTDLSRHKYTCVRASLRPLPF